MSGAVNRFAKCVEWRGSDVAEHDTDAADHEGPETGLRRRSFGRNLACCFRDSHAGRNA